MHFWAIVIILIIAVIVRQQSGFSAQEWAQRWYRTLFTFLFPPLLLFSTAATVLYMGCHGEMLGVEVGSFGCIISGVWLGFTLLSLLRLAYLGNRSLNSFANLKQQLVASTSAQVLDTDFPYSAQIGFWQPSLVISQGLLKILDDEHLAAVVAHEQAHLYYRDTFWFFWLGWVRSFSFWLPNTEILWQELILLRELRADRKAAEYVDFLLLAESLLAVAQAPLQSPPIWCASLHDAQISDRLTERIDYLLQETASIPSNRWHNWSWLVLILLPLLAIPLHC
ncbi:MAG: M56 family metallopeptidase [Cyanobacteria bacterium J06621_8]